MNNDVNTGGFFSDRLEALIAAALQDGVLTDKERELLKRRAEKEGEDWDEVEMIIDARLAEIQAEKGSATIASPAATIAAPKLSEGQEVKAEQEELPAEPINFKRDRDNNKPSLVIPEGVTVIDERACSGFDKLQSVTLPSTLTTIEESAFALCKKLEVIDFTRCSQLRSIGEKAFYKSGLTNVVLPASVEEIGSEAFSRCEKLTKVDLSACSQLRSIGENAFYQSGLTNVVLPASVEEIGSGAFESCYKLEVIDFTRCSQLRSIGENAFYKSGLTNVVLPASVEEIGSGAFEFCDKLEVIDFTRCSQLRSIGENAFYNSGLTNVVLPASVEEIVSTVFRYCEKLKKVDLSACIKLTSIADEAFRSCEKLSDVILPDSITHIGDSAFSGCPLKSIVLPASLEEMGEDVFEYCTSDLDSIDMSKVTKLKTIRRGFYGTDTTIIPQGVVEVEDNALRNYGEKLFLPPTLKTFGKGNGRWKSIYLFAPIFDQLDMLLTDNDCLYVLPQHLSAYRDLWDALGKPNDGAKILPMPDEYQYYYDN